MAMCMCEMGHPAEFCPGNSDLVFARGFVLLQGESLGGRLRSPGSERMGGLQETWLGMSWQQLCGNRQEPKYETLEKTP